MQADTYRLLFSRERVQDYFCQSLPKLRSILPQLGGVHRLAHQLVSWCSHHMLHLERVLSLQRIQQVTDRQNTLYKSPPPHLAGSPRGQIHLRSYHSTPFEHRETAQNRRLLEYNKAYCELPASPPWRWLRPSFLQPSLVAVLKQNPYESGRLHLVQYTSICRSSLYAYDVFMKPIVTVSNFIKYSYFKT